MDRQSKTAAKTAMLVAAPLIVLTCVVRMKMDGDISWGEMVWFVPLTAVGLMAAFGFAIWLLALNDKQKQRQAARHGRPHAGEKRERGTRKEREEGHDGRTRSAQ